MWLTLASGELSPFHPNLGMDSITQAALGASIGEVTLGRKVGRKAIGWGALVGSLADMDVFFNPLFDEVTKLTWHRGYSHSLLLNFMAAPLVGWLLSRLHRSQASTRDWIIMSCSVMIAAIMLDAFTVYGTQLLLPFSNYPVGFNTIAIVDPLFTVPLLLGILIPLFMKRTSVLRRRIGLAGLTLACTYLLMTVGLKFHVDRVAERNYEAEGLQTVRQTDSPTIFNSILWRVMAEVQDGYWAGYYSILDRDQDIELFFIPRGDSLLEGIRDERAVKTLSWFSQGWYEAVRRGDRLQFSDLRFGESSVDLSGPRQYIFSWNLVPSGRPPPDSLTIEQVVGDFRDAGKFFRDLYIRMLGD